MVNYDAARDEAETQTKYTLSTAALDASDLQHAVDETDLYQTERGDLARVTYATAATGYTSTKTVEGRVLDLTTRYRTATLRLATRDGVRVVRQHHENDDTVVCTIDQYGNERTIGSMALTSEDEPSIELLHEDFSETVDTDDDDRDDESDDDDDAPSEGDEVTVEWESSSGSRSSVDGEVVVDHYQHRDTPDDALDVRVTNEDGRSFVVRVRDDGVVKALHHATRRHDTWYGEVVDVRLRETSRELVTDGGAVVGESDDESQTDSPDAPTFPLTSGYATTDDIREAALNVEYGATVMVEYEHTGGSQKSVSGRVTGLHAAPTRDTERDLSIRFKRDSDDHAMVVYDDGEIHTTGSHYPKQGRVTSISVSTENSVALPQPATGVDAAVLRARRADDKGAALGEAIDYLNQHDAPRAAYLATGSRLATLDHFDDLDEDKLRTWMGTAFDSRGEGDD